MPGGGIDSLGGVDRPSPSSTPAIFMAMIETADIVAERYNVSREYQDEYSLESQMRMARAQETELFSTRIVPMATKMKLVDRETKEETIVDYIVDKDECNRPTTTLEALPSSARCAAKATTSPLATPASCPTALLPSL